MAKIDNIKRILKEDFPEKDRETIGQLGFIVNNFMEQVIAGFNKSINFDNLSQEVKEITLTVDASGVPTTETNFKNGLAAKIKGMQVIMAENQTNPATYPTNGPFITFAENNKIVNIKHVTGLQSNNKYKLRVVTYS